MFAIPDRCLSRHETAYLSLARGLRLEASRKRSSSWCWRPRLKYTGALGISSYPVRVGAVILPVDERSAAAAPGLDVYIGNLSAYVQPRR